MALNRNNPASPSPSDWGAAVDALQQLNQAQVTSGTVAFAGGGQANGTQLQPGINVVATVATDHDSVRLPSANPGSRVYILNSGASTLDVYGKVSTDTIVGLTTAWTLAAATMRLLVCYAPGKWWAIVG